MAREIGNVDGTTIARREEEEREGGQQRLGKWQGGGWDNNS